MYFFITDNKNAMIMYPRDRSITTLLLGILIFLFSWYMAIYFHNRLPDAKNQV